MTTAALAATTNRTRQHINRVCRQLFGTAGGWRRELSAAEAERVINWFKRPGCKGCNEQGCSETSPNT